MSDLIILHQEMLTFILNALNLVEVPCLSLTNTSHPINVILSFLRTQILIKILVRSTLCHIYRSLCSLLCHLLLLYIVHTPVMVQASIAFFLLLNSPLDFLVPPPSIFSLVSTSFGCHLLPQVVYVLFFLPRALFDNPFPEYLLRPLSLSVFTTLFFQS